jgi:uncharacterized protein (TIGR04255 family)
MQNSAAGPSAARRVYSKPPVNEAICRMTFAEAARWTIATPGQIYERFKQDYPGVPKKQIDLQAVPGARLDASIAGIEVGLAQGQEMLRLSDNDECRIVLVSPSHISVHSIKPYEGWESLERRLRNAVALLDEVYDTGPVKSVGLRYINRVRISGELFDLDEYFNIPIPTPSEMMSGQVSSFFYRLEMQDQNRPLVYRQTFASMPPPAEQVAEFILDLDFTYEPSDPISAEEAFRLANEAKETENRVFETLITEKCRGLFANAEDH